jgi:hypothetical protein
MNSDRKSLTFIAFQTNVKNQLFFDDSSNQTQSPDTFRDDIPPLSPQGTIKISLRATNTFTQHYSSAPNY